MVTGAAGGFGRATARRLHEEDASVALWDIDAERVHALAAELEPGGHSVLALAVDVGDSAAVDEAAARTRAELGPIDILVNNAGVVDAARPWEVSDESWERHFRVNAAGTFYCVRACLPDMRERRYGKIVNIGSLAAQQGRPTTNPRPVLRRAARAADGRHPAASPRRTRRTWAPRRHRGRRGVPGLAGLRLRERRVPERERGDEDGVVNG